jgi:hypothetical protein
MLDLQQATWKKPAQASLRRARPAAPPQSHATLPIQSSSLGRAALKPSRLPLSSGTLGPRGLSLWWHREGQAFSSMHRRRVSACLLRHAQHNNKDWNLLCQFHDCAKLQEQVSAALFAAFLPGSDGLLCGICKLCSTCG